MKVVVENLLHHNDKPDKGNPYHNERRKKRKRDKYKALLFLNPVYRAKGEQHYISHSELPDKATMNGFLDRYREARKAR